MQCFSQGVAREFFEPPKRIVKRLVTDHVKQADTTPQFQSINKEPKTRAYALIDPGKFQILPAVPGLYVLEQVTEKPSSKQNTHPKARVNKAIRTAQGLFVPDKFNPVSAVPNEIENVNISEATEAPVKVTVTENFVQEAGVASSVKENHNVISQKEERRSFKKCHGRCVQKFCLPVGILSVFEACTEKCKGICKAQPSSFTKCDCNFDDETENNF